MSELWTPAELPDVLLTGLVHVSLTDDFRFPPNRRHSLAAIATPLFRRRSLRAVARRYL